MQNQKPFEETDILEGKYSLKDEFGSPVPPEFFLSLFRDKPFYDDVIKFVRHVDNDTGIPFLKEDEYETARKIFTGSFINFYENNGITVRSGSKVLLRGKRYYLNLDQKLLNIGKKDFSSIAFGLLEDSLKRDLLLGPIISDFARNTKTLEERMLVGSLLDLYRNHLLILFTGLYESMKLDHSIAIEHYTLIRKEVETIIDDYYQFMISGKSPNTFIHPDKLSPTFAAIKNIINKTQSVYDGKRYLAREFDRPGRMILYAGHLLSQIKEKKKQYDLLVNLLNGSAEMGLGIQTIDNILGINNIRGTSIFEVDFARYSMKDREDKEISTYKEFEAIAIPTQLRHIFKRKVKDRDTLIVDDNLNTGQSLYNVRRALKEIARSVDISVAEVVPIHRVVELLKEDFPEADPHIEIKLIESGLTYSAIGWWRDQRMLNKERTIQKIIRGPL